MQWIKIKETQAAFWLSAFSSLIKTHMQTKHTQMYNEAIVTFTYLER